MLRKSVSAAACLWSFTVALFALGSATARAEGEPSVMVVFDGSGSMWGRIGGTQQPKFAVARDGLKTALGELKPGSRTGLMSYGHRRQGDCSDVQALAPLEVGDTTRIIQPLEKLNPRGKGPFVNAIREASALLKASPGRHHVVLLHDDPDNCQQDPCQAATELLAADPMLRIHVVSIAMKADDQGRPQCLARITGGRAVSADETSDLQAGIVSIFKAIAADGGAVAPVAKPAPKTPDQKTAALAPRKDPEPPAKTARRQIPDSGPPRLMLAARLAADGALLDVPVSWTVTGPDGQPVAGGRVRAAMPDIPVPGPGKYRVVAETGSIRIERELEVKAEGGTELIADLGAALVQIAATVRRGGPVSGSALLSLVKAGPGGETAWIGHGGRHSAIVPAGSYIARASDGEVRIEQQVSLSAGMSMDVTLALEAGRLKLAATARENGTSLTTVLFRVLEDDPEATSGLREVARSSAAAPDFMLPAGNYLVIASNGTAVVQERVLIRPGEETSRVVVLGLGRLRLSAKPTTFVGIAQSDTTVPTRYQIRRIDVASEPIVGEVDQRSVLDLAAGRYRLEIRLGDQNARAEREIEVKAGSEISVSVEIAAARVELKHTAAAAGLALADMMWEIVDPAGQVVWRTLHANPKVYLAPGRYAVRLDARDRKHARAFEVRAGSSVAIEVGDD